MQINSSTCTILYLVNYNFGLYLNLEIEDEFVHVFQE